MCFFPKYEYGVNEKGLTRKRIDQESQEAPARPIPYPSSPAQGKPSAASRGRTNSYRNNDINRTPIAAERGGFGPQHPESNRQSRYMESAPRRSSVSRQRAGSASYYGSSSQQSRYIEEPRGQPIPMSPITPHRTGSSRHRGTTGQQNRYIGSQPEGLARRGSGAVSRRGSLSHHYENNEPNSYTDTLPRRSSYRSPTGGRRRRSSASQPGGPSSPRRDSYQTPFATALDHDTSSQYSEAQYSERRQCGSTAPRRRGSSSRRSGHYQGGFAAPPISYRGSHRERYDSAAAPQDYASNHYHSQSPQSDFPAAINGGSRRGYTDISERDFAHQGPVEAPSRGLSSRRRGSHQRGSAAAEPVAFIAVPSSQHRQTRQRSGSATLTPSRPSQRATKKQETLLSGQRVTMVPDSKA